MKKNAAVFFLCFFAFALFPSASTADTVQLKNGNLIEGKVLEEKKDFVTVQVTGGKVKIPINDIFKIEIPPPEPPEEGKS